MTVDRLSMVKTPILIFVIYGFWCPLWWSRKWQFAYYCYSVFSSIMLITHIFTQVFNIVFNIQTLTELAANCMSLMPTIDACAKATNILVNRRKIVALLHMFANDHCKLQDNREMNIQRKCEKLFRRVNVFTIIMVWATVALLLVKPFLHDWNARKLPFLSWFPYAVDGEISFWSTYAYEIVSTPIVAMVDLANVLLSISLMGQISVQLDILSYRFLHLAKPDGNFIIEAERAERRRKLIDCINHHVFIFELAKATQRCFVATFSTQMMVGLVGICTGSYNLAMSSLGSPEFSTAALFVTCMFFLAFPCCWIANEVYLKSLEVGNAVYKMNWTNLEIDFQKDLLNICMRANRPILFHSGPALPLSNQVFMRLLQASYTAYAVLQHAEGRPSSNSVAIGA